MQPALRSKKKLRRAAAILIAVAFLAYGLLRLVVGFSMVAQELDLVDIAAFHEPLADAAAFLDSKRSAALIPLSVAQYVGYIGIMGLTLSLGAIGSLTNRGFGLPLIGTSVALYGALFINFQTINPKVVHLAVCAVLFLALLLLKKQEPG